MAEAFPSSSSAAAAMMKSESSAGGAESSRFEKSLGLLTQRFVTLLQESIRDLKLRSDWTNPRKLELNTGRPEPGNNGYWQLGTQQPEACMVIGRFRKIFREIYQSTNHHAGFRLLGTQGWDSKAFFPFGRFFGRIFGRFFGRFFGRLFESY